MARLPIFPALLVAFSLVAQTAPKPEAPKLTMPRADAPKPAAPKVDASHLTLQQAIEASLMNNLQVQISAETRNVSVAGVLVNQGAFDWQLTSGLNIGWSKTTYDQRLINPLFPTETGGQTTDTRNLTVGLSKPTEYGGNLQLTYNPTFNYSSYYSPGTLTTPPSTANTLTPYQGFLSASFTQSLLRNFGRDTAASNLIVAQYGSKAADYAFQLAIINQTATTEAAYWAVVFAKLDLE
ncbi:MAG: hypothetical protein P4L11_09200, partial [Geothrix sp.]|nr:hypothetical protein [Geothrix sp.]